MLIYQETPIPNLGTSDGVGKRKHSNDNVIMEDADSNLKKTKIRVTSDLQVCTSQVVEVGLDQPREHQ
jgi:hypothetical protein